MIISLTFIAIGMSLWPVILWLFSSVVNMVDVYTLIWLYFALKIFCTLLVRTVLISYAPHIVYETRVKMSLKNIRTFIFRTDGSVRN